MTFASDSQRKAMFARLGSKMHRAGQTFTRRHPKTAAFGSGFGLATLGGAGVRIMSHNIRNPSVVGTGLGVPLGLTFATLGIGGLLGHQNVYRGNKGARRAGIAGGVIAAPGVAGATFLGQAAINRFHPRRKKR